MDLTTTAGYRLQGLTRLNVVLGKNGCGKSTLLKAASAAVRGDTVTWGSSKYITPERGGTLSFDQGIEANVRSSPGWLHGALENNQYNQYKQQTVYQFDNMTLAALQRMQDEVEAGIAPTPIDQIARVNSLLDNIEIRADRGERGFKIFHKLSGLELRPNQISSGESELISLGIESLAYTLKLDPSLPCWLILDEPDVHLHPDLQARLVRFLVGLTTEFPTLNVLIATHSTPILGELSRTAGSAVAAMKAGLGQVRFEPIDQAYRDVLPVFGAHPLTSVFQESPILLVEGADDVRIWQQAKRTSQGRIAFYPVETGGKPKMASYENRVRSIADAVYEGATSYSLRDRDNDPESITDHGTVFRCRLHCRAAENLLLTEDVLAAVGTTWDATKLAISAWIDANPSHAKLTWMRNFANGGFDRKNFDLKEVRNVLLDVLETNQPWEVLVGKSIGSLTPQQWTATPAPDSLTEYLGAKLLVAIDTVSNP